MSIQAPSETLNDAVTRARAGVTLWKAEDLGIALVDGDDAATFLHNMLTADIKRIALNAGQISVQASPKGAAQCLLTIHRTDDKRYLMVMPRGEVAGLLERLEALHFSEKFTSRDVSSGLAVIAIQGPKTRQLIALASEEAVAHRMFELEEYASTAAKISGVDARAIRVSLTGDAGFLLVLDAKRADSLLDELLKTGEKLGAFTPDADTREVMRIEAGIPKFDVDLQRDAISSELGITHSAFNYDKGCFVGQEIIARIRTKGEAPNRLMNLLLPAGASVPEAGATLTSPDNDKQAATITSACYSPSLGRPLAIARVKMGYQIDGLKLKLGEHEAEVHELPLYVPSGDAARELYDKALTLFALNQESEAIQLLESALEENPSDIDALEALGVIRDRLGQHHEAIAAMKRVIEQNEKHLMANVNLSLYYMKIGDKETAEDYQSKATRISMERRMAEQRAQGKSVSGDDEAAQIKKLEDRVERFRQIIEMDPDDVLGHFGAGKACLDLKRFGEAASHFEKVVEIQNDYSVAWANLGQAYVALGEKDKAIATLEKGIVVAEGKGDMMPARDMKVRLDKLK